MGQECSIKRGKRVANVAARVCIRKMVKSKEDEMIVELLVGCAILSAFAGNKRDTRVKRGKNLFGCRYKEVSGECFRCNGSGKVHGKTCRKCGGTGEFCRTTFYD